MRRLFLSFLRLAAVCVFLLAGFQAHAQEAWDYLQNTNASTFSGTVPVEMGFINTANGNLHLEIPLVDPKQRGAIGFNPKFVYDSRIWIPENTGQEWVWYPVQGGEDPTWGDPSAHGEWAVMTDYYDLTGQLRSNQSTYSNGLPTAWAASVFYSCNGVVLGFQNFEFTVGATTLNFDVRISQKPCNGLGTSADGYSTDGSGYHMFVQWDFSNNLYDYKVVAPDGTDLTPVRDPNGNYFSGSSSGNFPLEDTLERQVVTVSGTLQSSGAFPIYYDVLNAQGSTSRYTANYNTIYLCSNFNQSGIVDACGYIEEVTSITLPDGTSYQFQYDGSGELSSITLPTGGTITYGFSNFTDAFRNVNRWITSRTSSGGTWSYTPSVITPCPQGGWSGCSQQLKVAAPSGDYSFYMYTINGAPWLTQIQRYSQAGSLLDSMAENYDFSTACTTCFGGIGYVHATTLTESLPSTGNATPTKQTTFAFDSPYTGNLTALKEWKFGSGGNPDRETDIQYQAIPISLFATNGGPTFVSDATIYKPTDVGVWDDKAFPGRMEVAETQYAYDSATLTSVTGASNHDDPDYGTGNTQRGNLTTITRIGTPNESFNYAYDTTGQVISFKDPALNTTTYSYGNNFDTGRSLCSVNTNAYPSQIQYQLSALHDLFSYDCGTGQVTSHTDSSGATTSFSYNDVFSRLTSSLNISGSWTQTVYSSPTQRDTYRGITDTTYSPTCTGCRHDRLVLDGLGRRSNDVLANDPDGPINNVVSYDTNGRASSLTNPYRSTQDTTYGVTTTVFDGLDRVTKITDPDGNVVDIAYGANVGNATQICTTTGYGYPELRTDEAGKQRLSWTDAFGNIIEVDEPTAPPPAPGTLSVATCYSYDLLGNLIGVTQEGGASSSQWRTSSFAYDGLSRIITAITPEDGSTSYYYTSSSSGLCSGDPNAVCRRVRGKTNQSNPSVTTTTTYTYDGMNRLIGESYSDGTPSVNYFYDETFDNGLSISYGYGRRTGMSDATGQTAWSYTALGEVETKQQTINGIRNALYYSFNLDGSIHTIDTPNGREYTYTYSSSQRPISLSDNANGITYVSNAHYAAPGELASANYGLNLVISKSNSFNNRLQPITLSVNAPSETVLSLGFNFVLPGGVNNGNVYQIQNNRDLSNNRSFQYSYDNLNRLLTASTMAGASSPWTTTYGFDAWGNLLQKSTTGPGEPNMGLLTADVHNHVNPTNYTYDAAGNLTWDGANALTFDAENRATPSSGSYIYSYDGENHRVEKNNAGSITYYWYDEDFNVISTTGHLARDYVYFNGERIAHLSLSNGDQYYYWLDHLGDTRVITNSDGSSIQWESDYYPFGKPNVLNNSVTGVFRFTGSEYDSELTGGDNYLDNREQSYVLGRFFSPDPIGGSVSNPQSWNRYAYVMNRPSVLTDPLGLGPEQGGGSCFFCVIGDIFGALLGLGGGHGPTFHPNGPPFGRSGAGQDSGPLQGETLGLPNSVRLRPPGLLQTVGALPIGGSCDFMACAPSIGEDFADQLEKNQRSCGDMICDDTGRSVGVLPGLGRGMQPTYIEFTILEGGFYLSRINSNPFLRIGPGYVKGGTKILRVVSGGKDLGWWWHIWNGPKWPF